MQTSLDDRLGFHLLRRVTPPESPFAGLLARDDRAVTSLLVEVGAPGGWPVDAGWHDGEHVLAPLDVIATHAGNEVVLPWCTETVVGYLDRRRASGHELTAGEAVTLGVCVLRGAREAVAGASWVGEWWLTGDGRPMFVVRPGEGARGGPGAATEPHSATLEVIAGCARDRGIAQLLRGCVARVNEAAGSCDRDTAPGRWNAAVGGALDSCEDELFATSSPAPLEMRSLRPRVARSLHGGEFDRVLRGDGAVGVIDGGAARNKARLGRRIWGFATGQLKDAAARHVDPEIADVAAQTWRRTQGRFARVLRRPVVVGLVLAALVLCVGVLWPAEEGGGGGGVAASSVPVPAPTSPGAVAVDPAPEPAPGEPTAQPETTAQSETTAQPEPEGIAGVASALLSARDECRDASDCALAVYEDVEAAARVARPEAGAEASSTRPIDAALPARTVSLVDDLGGVVVLRVETASAAEMLIIVQTERGWRIRDVFEVLDAPPGGDA